MARRLLTAFLILDGVAILGIWGINLAGGAFAEGLFVYREGNLPILHLTAEFLMAGAALAAGIALWAGVHWGRGLALFALGTLAYSGINSLGWALHNDPAQAIPMALTLVGVAPAVSYLLRRGGLRQFNAQYLRHGKRRTPC
ncbi:hypothetical protein ACVNPS_06010 [Candidatus Bipolaricaulota sp. J31]